MRPNLEIFTIGHSVHSIDKFIALLSSHAITALADVRSVPYSKYQPQFRKRDLAESLKQRGFAYVFLGKELGARTDDPSLYENGKVSYSKLAATDFFKAGMARVLQGATEHRIALMCAERDPLECHRTLLVAHNLAKHGAQIVHIHASGDLESHDDAMTRLLDLVGLPREDLFRPRSELVLAACQIQEQRIAYQERESALEAVS